MVRCFASVYINSSFSLTHLNGFNKYSFTSVVDFVAALDLCGLNGLIAQSIDLCLDISVLEAYRDLVLAGIDASVLYRYTLFIVILALN